MIKFTTTKLYLKNKELQNVESYDINFNENKMLPRITVRQKLDESWISFDVYWLTDMKKNGDFLELELAGIDENIL